MERKIQEEARNETDLKLEISELHVGEGRRSNNASWSTSSRWEQRKQCTSSQASKVNSTGYMVDCRTEKPAE